VELVLAAEQTPGTLVGGLRGRLRGADDEEW
jgi:hypothetical protein